VTDVTGSPGPSPRSARRRTCCGCWPRSIPPWSAWDRRGSARVRCAARPAGSSRRRARRGGATARRLWSGPWPHTTTSRPRRAARRGVPPGPRVVPGPDAAVRRPDAHGRAPDRGLLIRPPGRRAPGRAGMCEPAGGVTPAAGRPRRRTAPGPGGTACATRLRRSRRASHRRGPRGGRGRPGRGGSRRLRLRRHGPHRALLLGGDGQRYGVEVEGLHGKPDRHISNDGAARGPAHGPARCGPGDGAPRWSTAAEGRPILEVAGIS
jgi:hypothetical protein